MEMIIWQLGEIRQQTVNVVLGVNGSCEILLIRRCIIIVRSNQLVARASCVEIKLVKKIAGVLQKRFVLQNNQKMRQTDVFLYSISFPVHKLWYSRSHSCLRLMDEFLSFQFCLFGSITRKFLVKFHLFIFQSSFMTCLVVFDFIDFSFKQWYSQRHPLSVF